MPYIAAIYTGHPELTTTDQVDTLYTQRTISAGDYSTLVRTIAVQKDALAHPENGYLAILLADGRQVKVCKYALAEGFGEGSRVRIAKKQYASAHEEIEDRCKALMQAHPGMTYDEALRKVATDDSGIMAR
jgi:hypothetical protein